MASSLKKPISKTDPVAQAASELYSVMTRWPAQRFFQMAYENQMKYIRAIQAGYKRE